MKYLLRPFQLIYVLYASVLFVVIMLIIFPFVIAASFLGRIRGGNIIYRLCMLWGDLWFHAVFIFPKRIYLAPHDKKRSYIFVANHVSYLDAAFLVEAIRQPLRPLAKIEMKKIPVFGFIYERATVAVDRKSAEHRAHSVRILTSIIRKGISILVFPEGTFNMNGKPLAEFYDGAFRVAIETQTPIKPILFLDTYHRMKFHHVLTLNPGRCRCVYLEEIPVEGLTHHDVQSLKNKVYSVMEQQLKNHNAGWIKQH